jgi:hypothetical protein
LFFQLTSSPLLLLIGHVQMPLRLLNAGLSEHQLDDADVDTVGQEATGPFVPKIMPAEINPLELFAVLLRTCSAGFGSIP